MVRKSGKFKKKEDNGRPKKKNSIRFDSDNEDMMDDDIDVFHKKRDVVPLNIHEDVEESDEDAEQPVLDFEDDDEEDAHTDEDKPPKGLAAKIARTQKFLRAKFGDVEDGILADADEEEPGRDFWGKKSDLYGADVGNEDYGVVDTSQDETDRELTFQEILDNGNVPSKASLDKEIKVEEGMTYEIVKKDLNALTKEEQMDVVYSSAPELIGLLSELKDALEQLENKSEGQPVRDHPVVSHLVEIKSLLDKIKTIDDNLSFDMEEILNKEVNGAGAVKLVEQTAPVESDSFENSEMCSIVASAEQATVEPNKEVALNTLKEAKGSQNKHHDKQVGPQSMEMLKIRASLEEKLKQQGVFSSMAPKAAKSSKNQQPVNRQLETFDDFIDEAMEIDGVSKGGGNGDAIKKTILRPNKRKVADGDDDIPKRDDIGERRRKHELRVLAGAGISVVKIAPRARFAGRGSQGLSSDEADDATGDSDADSDLEFYKQVESKHAARLAEKSAKYTRVAEVPSLTDTVADDGKRHITNQIEKNRGLTRARKKLTKNPRKKYKLKHKKAEVRRKGQVHEIRKPTGSYGGEASGINAGISQSVRFKN
ncbi:hypothetical protein SASPL_131438 [Salvia splendens]|uniref:Sas10 C-terminal domain-containing protein n=1 Tax=Salvia splendens TaxID=180675 RepID=A0A8X8X8R0_SALSN|nr:hypothetical protein SASPL_131438 [Salvia splendens]